MPIKTPLLTLCITTLNRINLLRETLDSIIIQNNNEIEVVITDGGSIDDTRSVLQEYANKYGYINFINTNKKLGLDEGYHLALKSSRGYFSWCIADDDILLPNSLDKIIDIIKSDIDLLLVNISCFTKDLKYDLNQNLIPIDEDKNMNFNEFEKVFCHHVSCFSYTGTIILKTFIWHENDLKKYYNSWFLAYAAMASSEKIKNIYYLNKPIIKYRSACSSWTDKSFEIWNQIWPNHILNFNLFNKNCFDDTVLFPWKRFFTLLKSRAMGEYSLKSYNKIIKNNNETNFIIKIKSLLILIIPVNLLNSFLIFYMVIFRRKNIYSIYNLIMSSKNKSLSRYIVKLFGFNF